MSTMWQGAEQHRALHTTRTRECSWHSSICSLRSTATAGGRVELSFRVKNGRTVRLFFGPTGGMIGCRLTTIETKNINRVNTLLVSIPSPAAARRASLRCFPIPPWQPRCVVRSTAPHTCKNTPLFCGTPRGTVRKSPSGAYSSTLTWLCLRGLALIFCAVHLVLSRCCVCGLITSAISVCRS